MKLVVWSRLLLGWVDGEVDARVRFGLTVR